MGALRRIRRALRGAPTEDEITAVLLTESWLEYVCPVCGT